MEIVIVFAGESMGSGCDAINIKRDVVSVGGRERGSDARFRLHARNCTGGLDGEANCASESADGEKSTAGPSLRSG